MAATTPSSRRMSSNSVELFARGKNVAASVTFAHSLERPEAITDREAPIYFRLDFSFKFFDRLLGFET